MAEETGRKQSPISNENIEYTNLEQQLLTRNIDKAAAFFVSNPDLFNYMTFRQVTGDGSQMSNRLRGINNTDMSALYNIKTSALSLLRPKIRIFKVVYEKFQEEDGHPNQGTMTALPFPCYKEFRFSDNFGIETALTAQDYLRYESTKPNWRNVGLKSFEFSYNGEASGPIQTDITCTMVLTFKSLKDIQASPPGEPSPEKGGLRYSDLVSWAPASLDSSTSDSYNPKHYEIKVLLGYTQPSKEQLRGLSLSENEVKTLANIEKMNLILSLNVTDYDFNIREDGLVEMTLNYRASCEASMGTNQANIFGSTFRFAGAGGLEISNKVDADYNMSNIYRLDATLSVIGGELISPSCVNDKCGGIRKLKELVTSDKVFADLFKEAYSEGGKLMDGTGLQIDKNGGLKFLGSSSGVVSFFKAEMGVVVKTLRALLRKKIGLYKKDIYKSFMEQLIDGNNEDLMAPGSRLFCVNVDAAEVEQVIRGAPPATETIALDEPDSATGLEASPGEAPTSVVDSSARAASINASVKIDRCHLVSPSDPAVRTAVAQQLSSELETGSSSEIKATSVRDATGENYKFYFVYLGDIIELACKNAGVAKMDLKAPPNLRNLGYPVFTEESYFPEDKHNTSLGYSLKNKRILLGPMEYLDRAGRIKRINLAQFPVSFNFFRAWFLKKIIRPKKSQLSLNLFIRLLIRDLVIPALGADMSETFFAPNCEPTITSLTLPGLQGKTDGTERPICGHGMGKFKEALPMEQIIDVNSALFKEKYLSLLDGLTQESAIRTSYDYLLIQFTTVKDIAERKGDLREDLKDGIYHFNIGSDVGLLKNMTFTRVQTPSVMDLRTFEALQGGDMAQFKFPFDTNLSLVGNTLFIPGMYYYVDPTLTGLGNLSDPSSMAAKMNLGGYHNVLTVETSITPENYETTITGRQLGLGTK